MMIITASKADETKSHQQLARAFVDRIEEFLRVQLPVERSNDDHGDDRRHTNDDDACTLGRGF